MQPVISRIGEFLNYVLTKIQQSHFEMIILKVGKEFQIQITTFWTIVSVK